MVWNGHRGFGGLGKHVSRSLLGETIARLDEVGGIAGGDATLDFHEMSREAKEQGEKRTERTDIREEQDGTRTSRTRLREKARRGVTWSDSENEEDEEDGESGRDYDD